MGWTDRSADFKDLEGRSLRPFPLQRQLNILGVCTIRYAGWDEWFLVYTPSNSYLVRAELSEIRPYII